MITNIEKTIDKLINKYPSGIPVPYWKNNCIASKLTKDEIKLLISAFTSHTKDLTEFFSKNVNFTSLMRKKTEEFIAKKWLSSLIKADKQRTSIANRLKINSQRELRRKKQAKQLALKFKKQENESLRKDKIKKEILNKINLSNEQKQLLRQLAK